MAEPPIANEASALMGASLKLMITAIANPAERSVLPIHKLTNLAIQLQDIAPTCYVRFDILEDPLSPLGG